MDDSMDPRRYYDEWGESEWDRLDRNAVTRVEFGNTVDYLARTVPDGAQVLDAGGGAGRYAVWLAERGHDVTLLDLSPVQLEVAREKARDHGVADRVSVERGDIRALPFADGEFDAVCCLGGPLSHVLGAGERERALAELRRVGHGGAPVFVSVMGRLSVVRDHLIRNDPDEKHELWKPLLETGDYDRDLTRAVHGELTWVQCHFFRADELRAALEDAGVTVETLVGLEGLLSNLHERVENVDDDTEETLRALASDYREDPAVVEMSEHILAVGRV
jgi:SAM-dependent methyltransferase